MHEGSCADFKDDISGTDISMVQREKPPPGCWRGEAAWYFWCGENFRRVLENARTDDEGRRAASAIVQAYSTYFPFRTRL